MFLAAMLAALPFAVELLHCLSTRLLLADQLKPAQLCADLLQRRQLAEPHSRLCP